MNLSTTKAARVYCIAGVRAVPAAIDRDGIGNARTLDAVVRAGLAEHAPDKVAPGAWSHGGYVLTDAGRKWLAEQVDAAHIAALWMNRDRAIAAHPYGTDEYRAAFRMLVRAGLLDTREWPIAWTRLDRELITAEDTIRTATPALNEVAAGVLGATMIHAAAAAVGFDLTGAIAQADADMAARWDVARAVEIAAGRDGSAVQAHPATGNPIVWVDGDRAAELVELIPGRDRVAAVVYMASRSHGVPLRSRFRPTPAPAVEVVTIDPELDLAAAFPELAETPDYEAVPLTTADETFAAALVERCVRLGHEHVPAGHPRPDLEAVAGAGACYRDAYAGQAVIVEDQGDQLAARVDGMMYRGDGMVVRTLDDPDRPIRAGFARLRFVSLADVRAAELDAYAVRPLSDEGFYAVTGDGEPFRVRIVSGQGVGTPIVIRSYVLGSPGQVIAEYPSLRDARAGLAAFRGVCAGNGARLVEQHEATGIADARRAARLTAGDRVYGAALVANARWTPAA